METDVIRGDVYAIDIGGTPQPHLIIQNNYGNKYAPTTIAIPIMESVTEVKSFITLSADHFRCLKVPEFRSSVLVWEPRTVDKMRLRQYIGTLSSQTMQQVNQLGEDNLDLEESEVRWVHLPDAIGSEQGGTRPCLITRNKNGATIAVPVTKALNMKKSIPTHMTIDKNDFVNKDQSLERMSILLWEQQRRVTESDLKETIGHLNTSAKEKAVGPAKISVGLVRLSHQP